ncbi:hypothetical protein QJS04_geneDACA018950 [Acorus gramineus]|uniref:Uncharacterized protein n=2 Tax=Acorus TaxID=4464 RepID=A0AAV9F6H4_ACOCL|nr:hypothetical protein QJS04_geneDACA018950 [Acorus gramineus]KAK1321386.1 hypothetical protein QJS10_CPA03g02462 [Acorus calamus]
MGIAISMKGKPLVTKAAAFAVFVAYPAVMAYYTVTVYKYPLKAKIDQPN